MQVDLPAFERPTNAISGTSSAGKKCNCGAVVRNFAVCSQPKATVARAFAAWPGSLDFVKAVVGFVFVVMNLDVKPGPPL